MMYVFMMSFSVTYGQFLDCSNNKDAESKAVKSPDGSIAVLRIHSGDDGGKNSHECEADDSLVITRAGGQEAKGERFFASIDDWGRRLSAHLDGFTQDGKHVFGVISEGGKHPFTTVFDFDGAGFHEEIRIRRGLAQSKTAKCNESFAVAGTTEGGEIVLESNPSDACPNGHKWLLQRSGTLKKLEENTRFVKLHNTGFL